MVCVYGFYVYNLITNVYCAAVTFIADNERH